MNFHGAVSGGVAVHWHYSFQFAVQPRSVFKSASSESTSDSVVSHEHINRHPPWPMKL